MFAKFKINSGTIEQLRLQVGKVSLLRQSIVNDDVYPLLEDDCIQMSDPQKDLNDYTFKV